MDADNPLSEVHQWLDDQLEQFAYYGALAGEAGYVPGNGGEFSVLVPDDVREAIQQRFKNVDSPSLSFSEIPALAQLRRDGITWYHGQSLTPDLISNAGLHDLEGHTILFTASAARVKFLARRPYSRVCVVTVGSEGQTFRIDYGNSEYGRVPPIGFVAHLIAHLANLKAGLTDSAVMHVHPPNAIEYLRLSVGQDYRRLIALLYRQRPELLELVPELIGVVPYALPGSSESIEQLAPLLRLHRVVMLALHGVFVRENSIELCSALTDLLEASTKAASWDIEHNERLAKLSERDLAELAQAYQLRVDSLSPILMETKRMSQPSVRCSSDTGKSGVLSKPSLGRQSSWFGAESVETMKEDKMKSENSPSANYSPQGVRHARLKSFVIRFAQKFGWLAEFEPAQIDRVLSYLACPSPATPRKN